MKKIVVLALCFLLVVNGDHVEARRHRDRRRNYKLFVFGDSYVDDGNRGPASQRIEMSRQWYTPYGMSDSAHGNRATGRFSDGVVQSDLLAKILGQDESPPPYRLWRDDDDDREFTGLNFAVAGSSVFEGSPRLACLRNQTEQLRSLVRNRYIDEEDLEDSVALVAITGMVDYKVNRWNTDDDLAIAVKGVTDSILDGVRRLQRLGVSKVLVDMMPPLGCTPWRSWSTGYTACDSRSNMLTDMHNAALKQKLGELDDVLLLDINAIFKSFFQGSGSALSQQFHRTFRPCCDAPDPEGFCGQVNDKGVKLYTVCPDPGNYFYWDFWHPTQAAWRAIMQILEEPIKEFLYV